MNILVSNDDGINGKGLLQLVKALQDVADVYVVAPEGQRSSTSHHLTIHGKIRVEEREIEGAKKAYALWGTPADCVHLGLNFLFKDIDLVVSGINKGKNVSTDIIYSGTIAAAREAYLSGVPAVAASMGSYTSEDFELASEYIRDIALKYYNSKNTSYFINVNVPALAKKDIKGIRVCGDVTDIKYNDTYTLKKEDDGDYIYIEPTGIHEAKENDNLSVDSVALNKGYITVSPLFNNHISIEHLDDVANFLL